jgi:hypothetical protein
MMGEIADDMIDGFCCSECGMYFTQSHGYPVLCKDCWVPNSHLQKAIQPLAGDEEDV